MNENTYTQELTEMLAHGCARALIIAFAIICIGCALIPCVVACLFGWEWLLLYPVALILFVILVPKKK